MGGERELARVRVKGARCPFCHEAVAVAEEKRACEACMAWSHAECWRDHGACAACAHRSVSVKLAPEPASEASARTPAERAMQAASVAVGLVMAWIGWLSITPETVAPFFARRR